VGIFGSRKKDKTEKTAANQEITLSDGNTYTVANTVDCLGDSCPRPQLMTKKAVSSANAGDVVEILIDNPTSMEALPPMCPVLVATHLETVADTKGWKVYIRKD